jgi:hypothetical protein
MKLIIADKPNDRGEYVVNYIEGGEHYSDKWSTHIDALVAAREAIQNQIIREIGMEDTEGK